MEVRLCVVGVGEECLFPTAFGAREVTCGERFTSAREQSLHIGGRTTSMCGRGGQRAVTLLVALAAAARTRRVARCRWGDHVSAATEPGARTRRVQRPTSSRA